jgi:hypothetical protein
LKILGVIIVNGVQGKEEEEPDWVKASACPLCC